MEIYLDNAASTKPFKEVAQYVSDFMLESYANPSSLHSFGERVNKEYQKAQEQVQKALNMPHMRVVFTSGATESTNLAIKGIMEKVENLSACNMITTAFEHPCVSNVFKYYEKKGANVHYIPVDFLCRLNEDYLFSHLSEETKLVSLIWVNNELGSVNDINSLANRIKQISPRTLIHVDAVQGFGKLDANLKNIDMLSLSAHKFHGPKGVGALVLKNELVLAPQMIGGGQQEGYRSGTINAPLIGAMGLSCELISSSNSAEKMKQTQRYLYERLKNAFGAEAINTKIDEASFAPHIMSISFPSLKGEVLLHMLEQDNIYLSTSSACSSHKHGESVLYALGFTDKRVEGTLRISISEETSEEQIDYLIQRMSFYVKQLKELYR